MGEINPEEKIPFENLPNEVYKLIKRFDYFEQLLQKIDREVQQKSDQWFNLKQLCEYHPDKPAPSTVYEWVHNKTIPHYKKAHEKLKFLKSEIDEYLKMGRRKTVYEINQEAKEYVNKKRK